MTFRTFIPGIFIMLFIANAVFAAPVVHKERAATALELDTAVYQYVADLGGSPHNNGSSYTTGSRYILWDEVPSGTGNYTLPPNYYNTTVPRGAVFSTACSNNGFKVSADPISAQPIYFGNLNANYTTDFKSWGSKRLFSVLETGCNVIDVYFYIPGTNIPATVSGFGAVFSDVDVNLSAGIAYYGINGEQLIPAQTALFLNNGLSLLGVNFKDGERIAHVRIFSGTARLGDVDISRGGQFDVVTISSLFYGEPRAIGQHSSDFDGDGTSDYAVFRPSNGVWYILNSGSNTFSAVQFGLNGDIPVDGDFDGDSRNDVAVFRPSTSAWYILRSSNGQFFATTFGQNGDKPVVGDYDKDGKTDIAVWRPSNGTYYYLKSSNGQFAGAQWGQNGDIPIGAGF